MSQMQRVINLPNTRFINQSLVLVCARSPVIKQTLDKYGQHSLSDYLNQVLSVSKNPFQPRNDLLDVVYQYVEPLLGDKVAEESVKELNNFPVVLTANHHGVDFLAQSVQGSLVFSLRKIDNNPAKTVPIFACGNIPLNNVTYPKGLLLYAVDHQKTVPIRLPIFSDRLKKKLVSLVDAFDYQMLIKAEKHLAMLVHNQHVNLGLAATTTKILKEDYRHSAVLKLKNYSQQAVVLNNRIWKRFFCDPERAPELIYLELEKIAVHLLQIDLKNQDSLIWQIMFNPRLRAEILCQLDGVKACWDQNKLSKQIYQNINNKPSLSNCGTTFFWAIDAAGYKIPLLLSDTSNHTLSLQGRDRRGHLWAIPFNPADILSGLQSGQLLPSLFTCYSTIGFARGFSCCGGYFQAEYLASMKRGLITALHNIEGCSKIINYLYEVPSDIYLSGMQVVMWNQNDDLLLPAGPIEIIASGGLKTSQIEKINSLTVQNGHLAGLMETLLDFQSYEERINNCCLLLAKEQNKILKNDLVII